MVFMIEIINKCKSMLMAFQIITSTAAETIIKKKTLCLFSKRAIFFIFPSFWQHPLLSDVEKTNLEKTY